jgi:hypothetical protein
LQQHQHQHQQQGIAAKVGPTHWLYAVISLSAEITIWRVSAERLQVEKFENYGKAHAHDKANQHPQSSSRREKLRVQTDA